MSRLGIHTQNLYEELVRIRESVSMLAYLDSVKSIIKWRGIVHPHASDRKHWEDEIDRFCDIADRLFDYTGIKEPDDWAEVFDEEVKKDA